MNENNILRAVNWLFFGGLIIVVITVIIYAIRGHINFNDIDNTTIGTFGDFIGGFIGTLFGIVTLLLVWLTYNSQQQQAAEQASELRAQKAFMDDQKFEDTFFKLLSSHAELKKNIKFDTANRLSWWEVELVQSPLVISGDVFFNFAKDDFYRIYWKGNLSNPAIVVRHNEILEHLIPGNNEVAELDNPDRRIKLRYKKFLDAYHLSLGHYFRHLYYLVKYVDRALQKEITAHPMLAAQNREKYDFYIGVIQAQLSSSELFLLFYNGWCFPKMKALILKYNLLENLAKEDLADMEHHENLYGANMLKSRTTIIQ